jgi:gamma-glutamyl-gamma-aminobutyrate hydrolase PuuD
VGWADDELIEAVESLPEEPWLLAVQWHPEEMHRDARAPEHGLFAALVREARRPWDESVGEVGKEEAIAHAVQRAP